MKKTKVLILSLLFCCMAIPATSVSAAQGVDTERERIIEERYADYEDSDKVLVLPDGGTLQGQMDVYEGDKLIAQYDSETDPNSETVKDLKERLIQTKDDISMSQSNTRAATPATTDQTYVLQYKASYKSQPFSGKGWRFSEYQFKASSNTVGTYLKWETFKDAGIVGNTTQAYSTLGGNIVGNKIYVGGNYWLDFGRDVGVHYYTYNPVEGAQYKVSNVDA